MNSADFIQHKFQLWARRKGIRVQGSEGERGKPNYTLTLEENLFSGRLFDQARSAFEAGAGGELRGEIPPISALHSSAALSANLFQYWIENQQLQKLARILAVPSTGIESACFERKYPVCKDWRDHGFNEPPHLDLGIDYTDSKRVGIECKLFEPYGRLQHTKLKQAYLDLAEPWGDISACHGLAQRLVDSDEGFRRLSPAQLIRHILGLKFGTSTEKVRLIYLYYDAIGEEAAEHRAELARFKDLIAADCVQFIPLTVQEFVIRASRECGEEHSAYVDYLSDRYL